MKDPLMLILSILAVAALLIQWLLGYLTTVEIVAIVSGVTALLMFLRWMSRGYGR